MSTDEHLREAVSRSLDIFVERIEAGMDQEEHYVPSEKLEQKIRKLSRRTKRPRLHRVMHRAASFLLAAAVAGAVWLSVDVQARAAFFGWIRDRYEAYVVYRNAGGDAGTSVQPEYELGWVPNGYSMGRSFGDGGYTYIVYENAEKEYLTFSYLYASDGDTSLFYGGEMEVRKTAVGDRTAELLLPDSSENSPAIIWTGDDDTLFYISGYLSEDELVKAAEHIKEK